MSFFLLGLVLAAVFAGSSIEVTGEPTNPGLGTTFLIRNLRPRFQFRRFRHRIVSAIGPKGHSRTTYELRRWAFFITRNVRPAF